MKEPVALVRRSVAAVVAKLAKPELSGAGWPELLTCIGQMCSGQFAANVHQTGLFLLAQVQLKAGMHTRC